MIVDRRFVALYSATVIAQPLLIDKSGAESFHTRERGENQPQSPSSVPQADLPTIHDAVNCICCLTPASFREGVRNSGGKFLYRGEDLSTGNESTASSPVIRKLRSMAEETGWLENLSDWILCPVPDLLLPETYVDPKAVTYFDCLEARLSSSMSQATLNPLQSSNPQLIAKPSNGHIGTADPQQASQWGRIVSVWPLGDRLSYVWPRDRTEFFPKSVRSCQNDFLITNQDLARALQRNREVLFCSWFRKSTDVSSQLISSFLVVPAEYDSALRKALDKVNYGL